MLITSIRDLDKLMQLCRKRGIQSIEVDGVKFTLDSLPAQKPVKRTTMPVSEFDPIDAIDTNLPSEEELLFMSSGGGMPLDFQSPAWKVMQAKEKKSKAKSA